MVAALDLTASPALPKPAGRPVRHLAAVPDPARPVRQTPERMPAPLVLHAPSARSIAPPVRLTRRGVLALGLLTAALALGLVLLAHASFPGSTPAHSAAGAGAAAGAAPATVTVHAGDTLWSLAQRLAPSTDPRAEVDHLMALNHLADGQVTVGQVLRVR